MDLERFQQLAPELLTRAMANHHQFEALPWRYSVDMSIPRKRIVATCTRCAATVEVDIEPLELVNDASSALHFPCLGDAVPGTLQIFM